VERDEHGAKIFNRKRTQRTQRKNIRRPAGLNSFLFVFFALVDDLPAVLKASNFVLTQSGKPEMSLEQFRAEFSLPFKKFYDRHTPDVPMEKLEDWFHAEFKRSQSSVVELPHARDFLEFCRAKKFRTFLLSTVHADHFKAQ
jgi:phosphoglycolate phosphatase